MKISVIIPVLNGARTLIDCLSAIQSQKVFCEVEIIIIDSGSTDNSVEICNSFGCKIIEISPSTFNHGLTRNSGVLASQGDLLFFTVQDAILSNEFNLQRMVDHFGDLSVEAVVGIQGYPPRRDVNPALWFKQFDEPILETRYYPNNDFEMLSANDQFELSNWDNVNAMYRKSALLKIPFVETNYCEDWIWANQSLMEGMKLLRDPSVLVWHYHHMTFGYTFKSKFIINYYFYLFFLRLPQISLSLWPVVRRTYTIFFGRKKLLLKNKIYWIAHNYMFFISNFLSLLLFRLFFGIANKRGIDFLYRFFCKQIPQGKINFIKNEKLPTR